MKNIHLSRVISFGTVVLTGLLIVQLYWFNRAFDTAETQFDHTVQIALKKVGDSLSENVEVKKLSSNFFFVATESALDSQEVEQLLVRELDSRSLDIDYELGVYNAEDDTLVYGKYIDSSGKRWFDSRFSKSGIHVSGDRNFVVYFPYKKSFLVGQLEIWIFSTLMLVLMMVFFAFAIVSLLRERRYAELKTDFINNMTHEFKTPVTNINIAAEILKKKLGNAPESAVYIDILLKENEKLRQKIDYVLLGGSSEYQSRVNASSVDLHQIIRECAETFALKIQERNGALQLDFNSKSPIVQGDRELLMHVFSNLIDNAEKYSAANPKIIVQTKDHEKGVEIVVADSGIGIPSDLTTRVFDKFFRIKNQDAHNVKGFGLGLNFVLNVIRSHKGSVSLASVPDRGTEVKIFLPRL